MTVYIRSKRDGRFIGEFLGLGFFESSIEDGDCSHNEEPVKFKSIDEAQSFLDSWKGGQSDCFVSVE
jgi:hypothetical protein